MVSAPSKDMGQADGVGTSKHRRRPPESTHAELRRWTVAAAIMIDGPTALLVQNRRRNGSLDWSTPGGVVEPGEAIVDGLSREVVEETGLTVSGWSGPVYRVETVAAEMGWHLTVEVFHAHGWAGEVLIDDPDGIVLDAKFLSFEHCESVLFGTPRWVHEPLLEYLRTVLSQAGSDEFSARIDASAGVPTYTYELLGSHRDSMTVTRK
jgi:8-oxo-dGTP diphosphatase